MTFTAADQAAFASISGDFNPMHMDPVAARRLLTGRQVVHGVHGLMCAIELWLARYRTRPSRINCSFNNPISVGERVTFREVSRASSAHLIEVETGGLVCSRITLDVAAKGSPLSRDPDAGSAPVDRENYRVLRPAVPLELAPIEHRDKRYAVPLVSAAFRDRFPLAHQYLPEQAFAALCSLSYFVGMICPGMHSLFSSLNVTLDRSAETRDSMYFSVDKFDERFGLFTISARGPVCGEVRAFARPRPFRQASVNALVGHVKRDEFGGSTSLIIGGSRGLGELTAKILASGGGNSIITYAQGLDDAKAVSDDINASGLSACEIRKFELGKDALASLDADFERARMIYFFATPRIFRKKASLFDPALLDEFVDAYVKRFYTLCFHLESTLTDSVKIFYPSTVFVESRPRDLAEYAMAKAAAEILIADINRTLKKVSVVTSRLPRVDTDQTSGVIKVETESGVEALLPIVRLMCGVGG